MTPRSTCFLYRLGKMDDSFESIPSESVVPIFRMCTIKDAIEAMQTCKRFHSLAPRVVTHCLKRIPSEKLFDALEKSLRYGENHRAVRWFAEAGCDFERVLKANIFEPCTLLSRAASLGHVEVVRALLEGGARLNESGIDYGGRGPMHWAAMNGNVDCIRDLVTRGADMNLVTKEGKTPMHLAARQGYMEVVRALAEKGADLNLADSKGKTPMHIAARYEHVEIVRTLASRGADMDRVDSWGATALFLAWYFNKMDMCKVLAEHGANLMLPDVSCRLPASDGMRSWLHKAAYSGRVRCVRGLVEAGADGKAIDICGRTPLELAIEKRHKKTADILGTYMDMEVDHGHPSPMMAEAMSWSASIYESIRSRKEAPRAATS